MNDNVKEFSKNKVRDYPIQSEIYQRLKNTICEYDGDLSLAAMLGILRLIEHDLINDND